jgi:hypothetical protein
MYHTNSLFIYSNDIVQTNHIYSNYIGTLRGSRVLLYDAARLVAVTPNIHHSSFLASEWRISEPLQGRYAKVGVTGL